MRKRLNEQTAGGLTRGAVLRAALGGGAVVAGGAAIGTAVGGSSIAAQARRSDVEILRLFLTLERVQEAFYRAAIERGGLDGDLLEYAQAAAEQEAQHVAMLRRRLAGRGGRAPGTEPGDLVATPEAFRDAAVDLEEEVLAVYVGQTANLSDDAIVEVCTMVSVEARQAAWIRDLANVHPAPRAADPARDADKVLARLRQKGLLA